MYYTPFHTRSWHSVRYKITLAYTGTHFSGWQVQPGQRTVQGSLEESLSRICAQPVRVQAAGRTDAGVHALGQVVHCDLPKKRAAVPWQRALNSMLPADMTVTGVEAVDQKFHARSSALAKAYTYTLCLRPDFVLPQRRPFVWWTGPLDQDKMMAGAGILTGKTDFCSFMNVGTPVRSTVRDLFAISFARGIFAEELVCTFWADGFLKQMVRNLVAGLVAVGRGRLSRKELLEILESRDRGAAPATAPASGLCLQEVRY
ncbi:MAG: tRNA pseudouridine(38-40) synthase TruA [Desulfohalobiaceae bacterium]|nr:tRNA pseudouridine(38-40) synthase TruA [Desulfohalobiaceae bacterium]